MRPPSSPSLEFPEGFFWGAATSAYQIEGAPDADGKGPSIWDTFTHEPGHVVNNETGDVACDHYHRWRDDVDLIGRLGLNAYRFSISWPRVLPQGTGAVNARGLDFYDRLVDALLERGIQPFPTLYHWDLPQALQDRGGWPSRETASAFVEYAATVARRLGDRVRFWTTHNEPLVVTYFGHVTGEHAPGIRDPLAALRAAHHLLLSHGEAVPVLRGESKGPVQVGIALNLQPVHPASESPEDRTVAQRMDGLMNRWYLDPLFRGSYPEDLWSQLGAARPRVQEGDLERIAVPIDFLGVNYYSRFVARSAPDQPLGVEQVQPEGERSLMWEVYPQGLPELLERVWREYRPAALLVTENGMPLADAPDAAGRVNDERRIDFLRRHLAGAHRALAAGVPLRGYFVWSLLDNFEWALGYRMRFGLVHVDFGTLERTPKASAAWYGTTARRGGIEG